MHTLQDLKAPRHLAGVTQFVPGISDWPIERLQLSQLMGPLTY
jgi:hypothetical protein